MREFVARADARVVEGHCLSYGEGITYFPLVEIVKKLGGAHEQLLAGSPGAAEAIDALLGEKPAATTADEISWAMRKLLEAAAAERPLVAVFEDIHWGEPTFLDLIEQAAGLSRGAPILLLCTARPELLDRRPGWAEGELDASTVLLEPLDAAETDELLLACWPGTSSSRGCPGGSAPPHRETPSSSRRCSRWCGIPETREVVVPPTIKALLAARLDQLDPGERSVLERGSIEGQLFHAAAVEALAREPASVERELDALVRKELVRPERPLLPIGDAYRFRHVLIRDAAYDALPKATRAELHERFAGWLDRHDSDLVERDEIHGYHLEQAYRYREELDLLDDETAALGRRAAGHLVLGGRRAIARGDLAAAANLLERSLALGIGDALERVRVQLELGNALAETRRISEAEAVLAEAQDAATALDERGLAAQALLYRFSGRLADPELDLEELQAVSQRAVETFIELGDERGLAFARLRLGMTIGQQGRWEAGLVELDLALAHAETSGDVATRRRVIGPLVATLCNGPTPVAEGISRCEQLLQSSRNDRVLEAVLKSYLGGLYAMAGRFDEALELDPGEQPRPRRAEPGDRLRLAGRGRSRDGPRRRPRRFRGGADGTVVDVQGHRVSRHRPPRGRRRPKASPASTVTKAAGRRPRRPSPTAVTCPLARDRRSA